MKRRSVASLDLGLTEALRGRATALRRNAKRLSTLRKTLVSQIRRSRGLFRIVPDRSGGTVTFSWRSGYSLRWLAGESAVVTS